MRLVILLTLLLIGCSSTDDSYLKQDLDQVYIGSGVEKYFLADLPSWANFSQISECKRNEPIRYLHFEKMHKSYSMNYEQLVQFQFMLNRKFSSYKASTGRETIFLKDEAYIMHNVHQQILGGGRDFIVPNFNRIHLIWIDDIYMNSFKKENLLKLMNSAEMQKGHPIFVSTCLSSFELEKWVNKLGLGKLGAKFISQEMFNPYGKELKMNYQFSLDFSTLMPNKSLHFYGAYLPKEFKGIESNKVYKF